MRYSELKKGDVYYRYEPNDFGDAPDAKFRLWAYEITVLGKRRITETRLKKDGTHGSRNSHNFVPQGEAYLHASPALARLALIVRCQGNVKAAERRLSEALDDLSLAELLPVENKP